VDKNSSLNDTGNSFKSEDKNNEDTPQRTIDWQKVLSRIEERSNPQVFFWFSSLRYVDQDKNSITLEAKTTFDKDWIENHYIDFIADMIEEIYDVKLDVKISVDREKQSSRSFNNAQKEENKQEIQDQKSYVSCGSVNPNYIFESFIVGPSNQFAHAASYAAAQRPGKAYNPLFIYGGVGLGKTHIINAVGNHIIKNSEQPLRICCISAEHFTNQVINGIRTNKMEDFRNQYRFGCDVLLIDDIQFIAGKESTQEEFFHTFNTLYELKKQIVLTSDKSPHEMSYLEERLRSRFEWGLIADIQPPEVETRIAIISQKAESEGIELPSEVAMYIAQNTNSNVRELEGYLNNLIAHSKLLNTPITIELTRQVLKNLLKKKEPKFITVESIQKEVASFFDLRIQDLKSEKKQKNIAIPRQIAMFLSRKYTGSSFPEIGDKFGGKDHSTVIHAVRKIENLLGKDISLTKSINSISKKVESQTS
jgi:chromosomal replication initiator protein